MGPFRGCPRPSTRLARLLANSSGEAQTLIASAIKRWRIRFRRDWGLEVEGSRGGVDLRFMAENLMLSWAPMTSGVGTHSDW
jgi:hypothetical protein